jgi:hypothetical protein
MTNEIIEQTTEIHTEFPVNKASTIVRASAASQRGNPLIIFLSLLLSVIVFASFMVWWQEFSTQSSSYIFRVFVWSLVASDIFLLVTRAFREWANNR